MSTVALGLPRPGVRPGRAGDVSAVADPSRPASPYLLDRFGRRARDLRVSLTDRCNLRCTYCMPAEGLDWMPQDQVLSDDELLRLMRVAVERLGVEEIRFTGGEPLLRKGIVDLVRETALLRPRPEISLTTNGIGFARRAADFADAGLDRINISLDTLRSDTFTTLTRRPRHADVLAALAAATEAGLRPVKINAVLLRGVNDHEAVDLLAFALEHGYHLRFIEQMPLDAGHSWQRSSMITADEIQQRLQERFELLPHPAPRDGAPAELFDVAGYSTDGAPATVGIIASVTRPFCGDCDRTRLTADGQIRNCLFARSETDLRAALRSGADDEQLADLWRGAMWSKLPGHGIDDPSFLQPDRPMSAIGG
ncbi:GTP 3',8-cyclase MoaA [Nakamurella sp. YIM 132087]|uniref:GTP 3',8-cyclase n=1 Tax=Nakamurella alba TaxID=2665158 RepID=A0A7K1FS79_9ACTN|nr:GTP 3',8-cyclase MoaA [Nakamurella alba]MTD17007.1 GTP 3',8-cyclase MoaA [Nakamurella alba]